MEEYIYSSEYYCENCKTYHEVGVWFDGCNGYYVTDSDGDKMDSYKTYEEVVSEYPEGTPHINVNVPTYKKVRWYAVLDNDFIVHSLTNKSWRNKREWIMADQAPEHIRLVLSLPENPKDGNRMNAEIRSWADLENGLKSIDGKRMKYQNAFTNVIMFYVSEKAD